MATTGATAHDFWRLADEAERRGIRILVEPISGEHFATSASKAHVVYRLTGFSCTCPGFIHWQRCTHHALFLAQLGWLPDPEEPDTSPPAPASARSGLLEAEAPTSAVADPPPVVPANVVDLADRERRVEGLKATIDCAVERLASQLAAGHSEGFLKALAFHARFHRYSWNNALLIMAQCPHATRVAGLRRWNELGYTVKKGAKALWVWAPITRKQLDAATGEEQEVVVGFRPAPVWDASQLNEIAEKPLPPLAPALPDDAEATYRLAVARIEASGIAVEERPLPGGIAGASQGGRILIRSGLDSRTRLFTLVHELAHELAHQGEGQRSKPLGIRELEAEATAYVVAAVLGLENVGSRDYLLTYAIGPEELRASLQTVQGLVRRVLGVVAAGDGAARLAA